jgi:hypothetical protein
MVFRNVMLFSFVDQYLFLRSANSSTLKMKAAGASKMLVATYQTTYWHRQKILTLILIFMAFRIVISNTQYSSNKAKQVSQY